MMEKQTAVQYLIEEMQQRIPTFYAHYVMNMYEVYNKALEMEKDQMIDAYQANSWGEPEGAEQYYNQTYNNEQGK